MARTRPVEPLLRSVPATVPTHVAAGTGFDLATAWRDHGGAIFGYAVNSLGDRGAAEDCVQETYLRAWRAQERYSEGRGSQRTWLFAIARNVVVDAARARARRATPVDDDQITRLVPPAAAEQERVDDHLVLVAGLARLSPEHREVLVAIKLEGLTYAELAQRNGVAIATLRTRTFHALRSLRTLLGEEDPDARDT